MDIKRILLDEKDFKDLTKGKVIIKGGVEIALSDIGYHYMIEIIRDNWKGE